MGRLLRIDLSLGFGREPFSPVVRAGFVRWEAPSLSRRTLASDQARVAKPISKSDATIYAPIMHNYIYQLPDRCEGGVPGAADLRQTADKIRHSAAPNRQFIDAVAHAGRGGHGTSQPAVVRERTGTGMWRPVGERKTIAPGAHGGGGSVTATGTRWKRGSEGETPGWRPPPGAR